MLKGPRHFQVPLGTPRLETQTTGTGHVTEMELTWCQLGLLLFLQGTGIGAGVQMGMGTASISAPPASDRSAVKDALPIALLLASSSAPRLRNSLGWVGGGVGPGSLDCLGGTMLHLWPGGVLTTCPGR